MSATLESVLLIFPLTDSVLNNLLYFFTQDIEFFNKGFVKAERDSF